jgi:hypothetical protein
MFFLRDVVTSLKKNSKELFISARISDPGEHSCKQATFLLKIQHKTVFVSWLFGTYFNLGGATHSYHLNTRTLEI